MIILTIVSFWLMQISYKKEEYEVFADKIIFRSGTIFSDNSREVSFDKISEVNLKLDFLRNLFFKTGDIRLSTGASGNFTLSGMDVPQEQFKLILEKMQNAGFHLMQDTLVQEAHPHPLAIV